MTPLSMPKILMSEEDLIERVSARFIKAGVYADAAQDSARILVLAEMMGIETHGLVRVSSYCRRLASGGVDAKAVPHVEAVAPALLMVDGQNALGPASASAALKAAMKAARETGIAASLLRNGNHFGAAAPYCLIAAEAGFATIIMSNSTPLMPPTGGQVGRLGNNPIGFGFPNADGAPIIIDFSLSAVSRARIRHAALADEQIPEGWAVDEEGMALTDAVTALKGLLVPMGGHKGYALSLAVDMLAGVLSGAGFLSRIPDLEKQPDVQQNLGQCFIVIDASRLMPAEDLKLRITEVQETLRGTPHKTDSPPVRLPGQRAIQQLEVARRTGIAVSPELFLDA